MTKYLACPFCGGAEIRDTYIRDGRSVGCSDCSAHVVIYNPTTPEKSAAKWNTRAALEGSVAVPGPSPELVQQCKELLEWSKTGLLNGGSGGSVRKVAAEWEKKVGKHHALSVAESQIRDDAMREVVRLAGALPRHTSSPPPGSAPHNSGERLPSSDAATSGGDPADTRQDRGGGS